MDEQFFRDFALQVIEHFEFDQDWYQCPWCLWTEYSKSNPDHQGCEMVDIAALLGLEPRGAVSDAVAEILA